MSDCDQSEVEDETWKRCIEKKARTSFNDTDASKDEQQQRIGQMITGRSYHHKTLEYRLSCLCTTTAATAVTSWAATAQL